MRIERKAPPLTQSTSGSRQQVVDRFIDKYRPLLLPNALSAVSRTSLTGAINLGKLDNLLAKVVPDPFDASDRKLTPGLANRKIKALVTLAHNLDIGAQISLEPVMIDGLLKLAARQDLVVLEENVRKESTHSTFHPLGLLSFSSSTQPISPFRVSAARADDFPLTIRQLSINRALDRIKVNGPYIFEDSSMKYVRPSLCELRTTTSAQSALVKYKLIYEACEENIEDLKSPGGYTIAAFGSAMGLMTSFILAPHLFAYIICLPIGIAYFPLFVAWSIFSVRQLRAAQGQANSYLADHFNQLSDDDLANPNNDAPTIEIDLEAGGTESGKPENRA
ncbi:MAG: hypothetical protein WCW67_00535 [Candidatus Margulisiibacteriota bacterium]|jgi:hypothetical protein